MLLAEWNASQAPVLPIRPRVVMSTTHPTLGRLYWMMTGVLENGDGDYFGITKKPGEALRLPRDWRTDEHLADLHGLHIEQMLDPDSPGSDYFQDGPYVGDEFVFCGFEGRLAKLHEQSDQSVEAFVAWLRASVWVEATALTLIPAPDNQT